MSTSLDITVLDQSPTWVYSPDREGTSSSSWQSVWSGSSDSSYDSTHKLPNIAQGTSYHTTTLQGASAQIDFVGGAVSVYGTGTAGAYSTTLDGGTPVAGSPSGSLLASYSGLNDTGKHTVILKATQSQQLSLSYATFTIRSAIQTTSVANQTQIAVSLGANNAFTTNSFFSTSGSGFSNEHQDQNYTRLDTNSASATISFTCSNTSALFVYGTTNWDHQTFSFELDPPAGASQGARIFNGTSKWFVLDNLIFWEGGLDPAQTYQVKMTNLIPNSYTDLHSVVTMNLPAVSNGSASGSSSSSVPAPSNSSGATTGSTSGVAKTAAIAVSAVVALAALMLFAFLFCRRRAKQRRNKTRMTLDGMVATPFGLDTPPRTVSSYPSMSDAPMSLDHMGKSSSFHGQDPYSTSRYPYSINSANTSVQDFRDNAFGTRATRYSELSTDDFNPYSAPDTSMPHATGSTSVLSTALAPTAGQPEPVPTGRRRPEKGPVPSEASLTRPIRQEVDAGRVPEQEEVLPPNYDPKWAT